MSEYCYEMYSSRIKKLKFESVTKEDIESLVDSLEGEFECLNLTGHEFDSLIGKLILKVLLNK